MKKRLLYVLFFVFVASSAFGQARLDYKIDFRLRFDNREYNSDLAGDATLFGVKLAPELGLRWKGHSLMGGVDVTRHFGSKEQTQPNPEMILYYGYNNERNFEAAAGIFPRAKLDGHYARSMFTSTALFYDPLFEGAMLKYWGTCGLIEAACDWYSMKTASRYEKFAVYSYGRLDIHRRFDVSYGFMLNHFSGSETDKNRVDNIIINPMATYRFSLDYFGKDVSEDRKTYKSYVSAGWMQTCQRDYKGENKFKYPNGFMAEVNLVWRSLSLNNQLYVGDNIMPFYGSYGGGLYVGDPFFGTPHDWYNRVELSWKPRIGNGVFLNVCAIHHYDGKKSNWQQLVGLSVNLDRKSIKR